MREESSLKRQDVVAKRDSWVRTKGTDGKRYQGTCPCAGNWNRPSFETYLGRRQDSEDGRDQGRHPGISLGAAGPCRFQAEGLGRAVLCSCRPEGGTDSRKKYPYHLKGHSCWLRKTAASAKALAEGTKALGGLLWPACSTAVLIILFIALFGGFFSDICRK